MKKSILSALIWTLSLLPFWAMYRISDFLFVLIYYCFGYRKRVVYRNLRNSFPEKTDQEIQVIAKKFYRYLPDIFVEVVKMRRISKKEAKQRLEILNAEEVTQHFENGRSVIIATAHYANWELGVHSLALMTEYPKLIVYKPLSDEVIDDIFNQIRTRFGTTMVPMKQILRHIVKLRHQLHISVFAGDQTPVYQDSDYYMTFLNQETLVYTGTERIAKMTNYPVVFCQIGRKDKRGYYYCKFTTLVEDPSQWAEHEITHIYNRFTEQIIREEPAYWLWSHNRWKRKRRTTT